MRSASTGIFPKGSNCLKSSEPVVREAASSEEPVSIREVQHFAYCPHRWGLIHIGCDWSENAFVNRAKLIHERVDGGKPTALRGSIVERSVQVYDDEWGLFGVLDALELKPSDHGVANTHCLPIGCSSWRKRYVRTACSVRSVPLASIMPIPVSA